jgi:sarcosine oxidase gamma subunit
VVAAGFCAQTVMAQIGFILHQVDDTPTYHMLVYSGFALDFRDWIEAAASEFVSSQ